MALNVLTYLVLWVLFAMRLLFYRQHIWADITNPARSAGFFTMVAATCILGNQFVILEKNYTIASILWVIGVFLWVIIIYSFFAVITIVQNKPPIELGLNGTWLIAVVATQAVSILGTHLCSGGVGIVWVSGMLSERGGIGFGFLAMVISSAAGLLLFLLRYGTLVKEERAFKQTAGRNAP